MCNENRYIDELEKLIDNPLNQMIVSLYNSRLIPHSLWAECYRQAETYIEENRLKMDTRFLIVSFLALRTNSNFKNIIDHLEHLATRHYFYVNRGFNINCPILHQGIAEESHDSIICTCRSYKPAISVLIDLPECCQRAIYSLAVKNLFHGQSARLILGYNQLKTHVHAIGREKGRIVMSEMPIQSAIKNLTYEYKNPIAEYQNSIFVGGELLKHTYELSGYEWNDRTVIQFVECARLRHILYQYYDSIVKH